MPNKNMMRIGKTVLLKVGGGIKSCVATGHSDETDIKRCLDFGVKVDEDALKSFLGVKAQKKSPKATAKKAEKAEKVASDEAIS